MGYCTQLLYPIIMTEQQIAVIVVQMHAVAFAIAEHFTVGTLPFACPFTVAVRFEFVVPDVDEFIFVDIPLWKLARRLGQPEMEPSASTEAVLIPALHWKMESRTSAS